MTNPLQDSAMLNSLTSKTKRAAQLFLRRFISPEDKLFLDTNDAAQSGAKQTVLFMLKQSAAYRKR